VTENNFKSMKVGDIVAKYFRSTEIFKKAGIDFCCGGYETLADACTDKNIDIEPIEQELTELALIESDPAYSFSEWPLDVLCDHIVNEHHKKTMELLPQITFYTQKIAEVHGSHHPELIEIADLFTKVNTELTRHINNEEKVLFPALKEVLLSGSKDSKFITLREMAIMKTEHEYAGSVLDVINDLTNDYTVPPDGCSTYALTFKLLKRFADDLQIHVHLENNILYPKALELAK
jgi:regulator of cell morphogenesis and NO signaling